MSDVISNATTIAVEANPAWMTPGSAAGTVINLGLMSPNGGQPSCKGDYTGFTWDKVRRKVVAVAHGGHASALQKVRVVEHSVPSVTGSPIPSASLFEGPTEAAMTTAAGSEVTFTDPGGVRYGPSNRSSYYKPLGPLAGERLLDGRPDSNYNTRHVLTGALTRFPVVYGLASRTGGGVRVPQHHHGYDASVALPGGALGLSAEGGYLLPYLSSLGAGSGVDSGRSWLFDRGTGLWRMLEDELSPATYYAALPGHTGDWLNYRWFDQQMNEGWSDICPIRKRVYTMARFASGTCAVATMRYDVAAGEERWDVLPGLNNVNNYIMSAVVVSTNRWAIVLAYRANGQIDYFDLDRGQTAQNWTTITRTGATPPAAANKFAADYDRKTNEVIFACLGNGTFTTNFVLRLTVPRKPTGTWNVTNVALSGVAVVVSAAANGDNSAYRTGGLIPNTDWWIHAANEDTQMQALKVR